VSTAAAVTRDTAITAIATSAIPLVLFIGRVINGSHVYFKHLSNTKMLSYLFTILYSILI
jgi:hypothetical protein